MVRRSGYLAGDMQRSASVPAVLRHLGAVTDRYRLDRKVLVSRTLGEGRELLRALSRLRGSWIGWEVTTPRRLAMELVAPGLAAEGRELADPYEEQAAVDRALDEALRTQAHQSLRELAETPGFRRAVLNAVDALRLAGVDPARVGAVGGRVQALLADVLVRYDGLLSEGGRVDTAEVLTRALGRLDGPGSPDPARVFLVPGLGVRGAAGRLVEALLDRGAIALRSDPVVGLDRPPVVWEADPEPAPLSPLSEGRLEPGDVELELFCASGPAEEIRDVLRRVMASDLRWDEVEIIATDPVVYGGALHVLAERLGVRASYAVGLPVERTRPGRAVSAYFRWIEAGYPADEIRRLLESGDLEVPGEHRPVEVARWLRRLRIGWGRDRYVPAIERSLEYRATVRPRRGESEPAARRRVERERAELEALRSVIAPILDATPRVGQGGEDGAVSPAALASGLRAFLDRVAAADEPSATARDRLTGIVDRVAATLHRETRPQAAIAVLRRHLEIRVPAPQREGAAPWVSDGGHLHLSDVEHGGYSGRRATFVVGLDADRFPGAGLQDPLLLDAQRKALDPDGLPTASDRLGARRFELAACLARLRGRVTLSYSAWEPTEARAVAPASILLDGFRAATGSRTASFEDLLEGLGDAASPVARSSAVDATDVWFQALETDGILASGTDVVRAAHPGLGAGLDAAAARTADTATAHHGVITPRRSLDPRENPDLVLSASGLEDLGACGLRYFYRYALGIRKPEEPELDPDAWLSAMDRGRLLHSVFETLLSEARARGLRAGEEAFTALALEVLDRETRLMAREVPPPGEAVRRRELRELRADVRSFAHMMEGRDDRWRALELRFGFGGDPPAPLELTSGEIRLRGAIDRVDEMPGGLVVVDYKTGGTGRYERRHGIFNGGRRLQNLVYTLAAEWALESDVSRMEYHFPTWRGQNEVIGFERPEVERGRRLIDLLLRTVADGRFLPTEDADDCRFCDYRPICRHRTEGWRRDWETPLADWAQEHHETLPEYRERRDIRVWDDTFLAELEADGEAR